MSEFYQQNRIPASYIFSYWIFAWALLFILVKYYYIFLKTPLPKQIKWFNPSLVVLVALIWNTESIAELIVRNVGYYVVFKYTLMTICIKLIPLLLVWTWDINLYRDLSIIAAIFVLYCAYLWVNGTDFFAVYEDLTRSVVNDENRTPFEYYFTVYAPIF